MSEIKSTRNWFAETGQIPLGALPNVRQTSFYLGMQVEELAEKLTLVFGSTSLITKMEGLGAALKAGTDDVDEYVGEVLSSHGDAKEFLDADADLLWVTIGAAAAAGSDLYGAYNDGVAHANWAKKFPDGTFHRDPVTGKVLKPEGWVAADLTPFVHPTLRGEAA